VQEQQVRLRLRLNDLPQDVQDKIAAGKVSIVKALKAAGAGLTDDELREAAEKKTTRRRLPTLTELKEWYEKDISLSEEVRKFIAKRLLQVRWSPR
jgi:hypothetical protein